MALQAPFTRFGHEFAEAYHKINSLSYNINERIETTYTETVAKDGTVTRTPSTSLVKNVDCRVNITIYPSAAERAKLGEVLGGNTYNFTVDLDSEVNWIEQAYEHLKTLDVYADAETV